MKFLTTIIILLFTTSLQAQPATSWMICLDKKILLKATGDKEQPVIELSPSTIIAKPQLYLSVQFKQVDANTGWQRSFFVTTGNDEELAVKVINNQSGQVAFKAAVLVQQARLRQPVFIYTSSVPKNKEQAAVVRVRRQLLCKIEWK